MDGTAFSAVDDDRIVEAQMLRYWTRFAADGNPNGGADAEWPRYVASGPGVASVDPYLLIDVDSSSEALLKREQCDFWLSLSVAEAGFL
jgi:carboxylesterase type B